MTLSSNGVAPVPHLGDHNAPDLVMSEQRSRPAVDRRPTGLTDETPMPPGVKPTKIRLGVGR